MEKCALITGSSSGLGLEITKFLIESGYTVFGGSRSGTEIKHERYYDLEFEYSSELFRMLLRILSSSRISA